MGLTLPRFHQRSRRSHSLRPQSVLALLYSFTQTWKGCHALRVAHLQSTFDHLVTLLLEKTRVQFFVGKLNSTFSKLFCIYLQSTLSSLYRISSTMPDCRSAGVRATSIGSDGQCQYSPAISYAVEEGLRVFPSAASHSLSITLSACHPDKYPQLVLTGAFLMLSTYPARH